MSVVWPEDIVIGITIIVFGLISGYFLIDLTLALVLIVIGASIIIASLYLDLQFEYHIMQNPGMILQSPAGDMRPLAHRHTPTHTKVIEWTE